MQRRREAETWRTKDDREWRIGSATDVAWIAAHTLAGGRGITFAVPARFDAYATVQLPVTPDGRGGWSWDAPAGRRDASVLRVLLRHTLPQPWWLGYLETGIGAETIFYDVPKTRLYGSEYVLIEAGPEQAGRWRAEWGRWKGILPDLMFPGDRSWLASTLWDDHWMSVGGSHELVTAFLTDPDLRGLVHRVDPSDPDMTPPRPAHD